MCSKIDFRPAKLFLDILPAVCYNMVDESSHSRKIYTEGLDKSAAMCYNL